MIIPKEVQCRTCAKVFCCAKCRQKHEDGNHQEAAMLRKICYICNDRPFPLRKDTKITPNNLLVAHIVKEHLPLQCNRCQKVFYTWKDFEDINKCFMRCADESTKEDECYLERSEIADPIPLPATTDDENKENVSTEEPGPGAIRTRRKSSLVSSDVQAFAEGDNKIDEVDEALLTPLTKINLRWKRKSRQSFESLHSATINTSEVNGSVVMAGAGAGPGGARKLVRTTSTPMYQWQLMPGMVGSKHPNESYSVTMGQMSSIHCSSGSETDSRTEELASSPIVPNELDKVRAIIRNRSKAVATPLRQVMSKSIQRAIAQHTTGGTGVYSKMLQPGTQRKMSFNSTMSSGMNSMIGSPNKDPLDLRTTPALKRSASCTTGGSFQAQRMMRVGDPGRERVQLERMVSMHDEDPKRPLHNNNNSSTNTNTTNGSEYYEAQQASEISLQPPQPPVAYPVTPKPTGTALKKVLSFHPNTDEPADELDVWGTPCAAMPTRSYSCSAIRLGDSLKAYDASVEESENDSTSDDVFLPAPSKRPNLREPAVTRCASDNGKPYAKDATRGGSKLWSIVSNVIRLASRGDVQEELAVGGGPDSVPSGPGGLIRRAASFADYLKNRYTGNRPDGARTSSSGSDDYRIMLESTGGGKKRRRVASTYSRMNVPAAVVVEPSGSKLQYSPVAKRKRIQSRQPIQRLRNTSSESGGGSASSGSGFFS
uniref:C2H2-type domain-containing protein n=1 Tax=Anopheles farauti TaxID=69004 RepID=A0A182Q294_9DIPT